MNQSSQCPSSEDVLVTNLHWRHSVPSLCKRRATLLSVRGVKSASSWGAARIVRRFSKWTSHGSTSGRRKETDLNWDEVTLTRGAPAAVFTRGRLPRWGNAYKGCIVSNEAWWARSVGKLDEEEEEDRRSTSNRNVLGVAMLSRTPWAKPINEKLTSLKQREFTFACIWLYT